MTPTIIIDFHDSVRGRDALALARSLGELTGARLVTVTSYLRGTMLPLPGWHSGIPRKARATAELAKHLVAADPGAVTRLLGASSPARALHETAEREQADLVVLSSNGLADPGRVGAGTTVRQALQSAPCAVAVAPAGLADADTPLAPLGVAFDGSRESGLALSSAAGLAEALRGELRVVSVLSRPASTHPIALIGYREQLQRLRDERQDDLMEALAGLAVRAEIEPAIIEGEAAEVLAAQTEELGLLVMGSRGYGPLRRVLLGSVSDALLERAACPLMIVPRGIERGFGAPVRHALPARSH
jgi:nucleotide-binding universal stress UspA family protein